MHGSQAMTTSLASEIMVNKPSSLEVLICPPLPYLADVARLARHSTLKVGAQDVSEHQQPGAFTGEVAASMLSDIGAHYVLVGHSERRNYHQESNTQVARKFLAACDSGLIPILCVGETLEQRHRGQTESVIATQLQAVLGQVNLACLDTTVIAYEPIWAIGSGRVASPEQAQSVHVFIRSQLTQYNATMASHLQILYGGSVKANNAAALFAQPDVDGGLIGGAALEASEFLAICRTADACQIS